MPSPYKSLFPRAAGAVYLDTASEGLPLADCREALLAYLDDKSLGTPGRRRFQVQEQAALAGAARLLNAPESDVALLSSASEALNVFANSVDWRPGDEVLISDLEFPSGVLVWLRLRDRGVRVRVLESKGGAVSLDDFADAIGPSTRVVCVSHVSYKNGARIPFLPELSGIAHERGAMLVVDATQSLGRLTVPIDGVDFLVASSYKWLMSTHGAAVVYLAANAAERLTAGAVGWYSVRNLFSPDRFERFETKYGAGWMKTGMPAYPSIYVLRRALDFVNQRNIARIDSDLKPVVQALFDGVRALGLELLTPCGAEYASGIVSFLHPQFEAIGSALEREGVIVTAIDGRVRVSVHLYNDLEDVERFLQALAGRV